MCMHVRKEVPPQYRSLYLGPIVCLCMHAWTVNNDWPTCIEWLCVWMGLLGCVFDRNMIFVLCGCMITGLCDCTKHTLSMTCVYVFQGVSAVSVFKECARMRPEDPSLPLLAAKICIGQLHWVNIHTNIHACSVCRLVHITHTWNQTARLQIVYPVMFLLILPRNTRCWIHLKSGFFSLLLESR